MRQRVRNKEREKRSSSWNERKVKEAVVDYTAMDIFEQAVGGCEGNLRRAQENCEGIF
jgi:hypothetical protein